MHTSLIMFSIFLTGSVVTRRDPAASNTLMVFAMVTLFTGLGYWAWVNYGH